MKVSAFILNDVLSISKGNKEMKQEACQIRYTTVGFIKAS